MPFLLKRLLSAVSLVFATSLIVFLLLSPAFDDIARNVLGENASADQVEQLNAQLGLDRPVFVQYFDWLAGAFTGDLGQSLFTTQTVWQAISVRMPVTVALVVLVTLLSGILGFAFGVVSAIKRGWVDRTVQFFTTLADALPAFIIALFLVTVFAIQLGWLPATGFTDFATDPAAWARSLVLPVTALTVVAIAGIAQQVRSSMITALRQDYVRTLRSRGIPETRVVLEHALRNASTTGLTALAIQVVGILGGAVVIEQIFALPGLGSLAVEASVRADVPLVLGAVLAYVVIVVVVNLLVDLAVAWLNPKVRLS
ncbi:ABC transporter permease [Microbacterium sp. HD4P20]|uniref:ABC transporter permease n=1 Tax=Microbacterium sp. HD4P20 TaxID=2864874 RepID=UPI001C63D40F|nr:ABC transporter permease [Microbacterium sp. HD4P20]MCP2635918.1 ABC transporter permease [Microbacterium sp. HD4P20]